MSTLQIVPPQLPANLEDSDGTELVDDASVEACRLQSVDLTGQAARAVSLDEVTLEKVTLAEAKLDKFTGRDIIAQHCDFSSAHCSEAGLQRVLFEHGRMTGMDCNKANFKDVTFVNCKLDLANFRFSKLTRVKFNDCVLSDADFLGATLTDVIFENCVLERTDFGQCTMKNVDLRSSPLSGLRGWQSLKGATIDHTQLIAAAPYLAVELGIIVQD